MRVLGFTETFSECACGKKGLKGVYVVETENGDTLHLGSTCVKKKWGIGKKELLLLTDKAIQISINKAFEEWKRSPEYKLKIKTIQDAKNEGMTHREMFLQNREISAKRKVKVSELKTKFLIPKQYFNIV